MPLRVRRSLKNLKIIRKSLLDVFRITRVFFSFYREISDLDEDDAKSIRTTDENKK